jgi:N-acyl-D-amino-acid deacylase
VKHIIAVFTILISMAPVRAEVDPAVKAAVVKSLKRIEQGVTNYPDHRSCFSCHHQAMGVLALKAAQKHGFEVDAQVVKKAVDFSLKTFRNKATIAKGNGVGGDSTGAVYVLHMFMAVERPYDDTTAALIEYLLVKQRKDGSWPIAAFGDRPPTMGSLFTNAGLAMAVLKTYGPPRPPLAKEDPRPLSDKDDALPGDAAGCWQISPFRPRTRYFTCAAWWTPVSRPSTSKPPATA